MEVRRFFAEPSDYKDGIITLGKRETAHAAVLRQKVGYEVVVALGNGYDYKGVITSISKDSFTVKVVAETENVCETRKRFGLFQCTAKSSDFILQKAVELGFSEFVNVCAERSNAKITDDRLRSIAFDAAKQCGRARIPDILSLSSVKDAVKKFSEYDIVIFPYENASDGSISEIDFRNAESVAVIIGAEGGFTVSEAEAIIAANAKCVTLGKRILRAETAAVSAMTLALEYSGELK